MTPSAGIVVADRYRLERPLGQGGMGAVWLAYHVGLRIPCAVKFILDKAAQMPDVCARFEREAVAAAQLRSPNVVQILDHGVWDGAPYIAMELLDGEDLAQRLQRVGRLGPAETAAVVGQVARALTRAHAAGLVHRDLKPANVFLVRDDDREIVKVLDFGVAKMDSSLDVDAQTKTGALLGTPYYMSPEQAQGAKNLDHHADLWALAVLTFECLTGTRPFTADALGSLFMMIIVNPLPIPSQYAPVPAGFDGWWLRAAARDQSQRFHSAREMAEALDLALGLSASAARITHAPFVPTGGVGPVSGASPVTGGAITGALVSRGGLEGSLAAASSAVAAPPAASRGILLAVIGVLMATLVGVGAFVAFGMSTPAAVPTLRPAADQNSGLSTPPSPTLPAAPAVPSIAASPVETAVAVVPSTPPEPPAPSVSAVAPLVPSPAKSASRPVSATPKPERRASPL